MKRKGHGVPVGDERDVSGAGAVHMAQGHVPFLCHGIVQSWNGMC